ncbi:terpenoid cyclases/Protein prenyltransferase [Patellaria atrata CBS 101060]|uniref:Terpenoid cyclases/Protein prenyltransferase n=1 Tax=Patellaria atrata CBS 101060 TaxID=1346257 RepID=A0A9P4VV79_9PEZI|nr:terpenoid cyclases/Protein prenyltransferase [Patellaria atrata CBS 101060]
MAQNATIHPGFAAHSGLDRAKHINYWKRCLKTYLPHQYTSNDSNRLMLSFFIISALDLLGALLPSTTPAERADYARFLYSCQHPEGGFRGFPGTDFGQLRNKQNKQWDPANIPATYFALSTLILLGDSLQRVNKRACLRWLLQMQREDGSFGEILGENGQIEGGQDTRFGYCATGIRYILRGHKTGSVLGMPDINVDKLVDCIRRSQTYDGGISEAPFHEAHAGFTYCAISTLSFLDRLPNGVGGHLYHYGNVRLSGLTDLDLTVRWFVSRQTTTLDDEEAADTYSDETDTTATCHDAHSFVKTRSVPAKSDETCEKDRPPPAVELQWIGFNGRPNKVADTCYAWWTCASMAILGKLNLLSYTENQLYLLSKPQHAIGGFGKLPGDPPDIYHSYLGLAALGVLGNDAVKPVDPALCFSKHGATLLKNMLWRKRLLGEPGSEGPLVDSDDEVIETAEPRGRGVDVRAHQNLQVRYVRRGSEGETTLCGDGESTVASHDSDQVTLRGE